MEREEDNCFTRWRLQIIVSLSSLPWPADDTAASAVQCIVLRSNISPAAAQSAVACSEWPAEQRPYLALPCFLLLISTGQQQQHPAPEHQHSDQDREELTRHYTTRTLPSLLLWLNSFMLKQLKIWMLLCMHCFNSKVVTSEAPPDTLLSALCLSRSPTQ